MSLENSMNIIIPDAITSVGVITTLGTGYYAYEFASSGDYIPAAATGIACLVAGVIAFTAGYVLRSELSKTRRHSSETRRHSSET